MAAPTPDPTPVPDTQPTPLPAPTDPPTTDPPDDDPPILTLRRWLSAEEIATLDKPRRRKLRRRRRKAHNLKRWPATDDSPGGRPPWLGRAKRAVITIEVDLLLLLAEAAKGAVIAAAVQGLATGQLRHEFALATLLASTAARAADLVREDAAELIEGAFGLLVDAQD